MQKRRINPEKASIRLYIYLLIDGVLVLMTVPKNQEPLRLGWKMTWEYLYDGVFGLIVKER